MIYSYLKDSSFLQNLLYQKLSEQFIKIIVLNFNEKPIKEIQGKVSSGNLNLNGKSTVRRTGNITVQVDERKNDLTDIKHLFSINKKIKIEVGLLNNTSLYPQYDVLWFPLGIFVISNPSVSNSGSGVSISLTLNDKMSLLNGDFGGTLSSSVVFHEYEIIDPETGEYIVEKPTIVQIIQELVNHFGGEQLGRIIISDIDTRIKKVMKWTGSTPLYRYRDSNDKNANYFYSDSKMEDKYLEKIYNSQEDIGYIYSDFYYPGELIANVGDSICTILDKIKNTLGNFEYFYDIHGNFIFQEIKNYLNTSKATVDLNNLNNENYLINRSRGKAVYTFNDSTSIISFSNNLQYNKIRNDFVVWGMRESSDGLKFPIRYHLAIDSKPKVGNTYNCFFYEDEDKIVKAKVAIEYFSFEDFPKIGNAERFYLDKTTQIIYKWDAKNLKYIELESKNEKITTSDWRTELYLSGVMTEKYGTDSNYYYAELENEWPKLYNVQEGSFYQSVLDTPRDVDYFLDFIDSNAAISELSISNIGRRTKVINDDKINCVFEPDIPNFVIIESEQENTENLKEECINKGQKWAIVDSNIYSKLSMGGNSNSAFNKVQELLYEYTSYNETISIQAMPAYFLEPNIRITVRDFESGIQGDYMINSISLPFDINGKMTLSCSRALERF